MSCSTWSTSSPLNFKSPSHSSSCRSKRILLCNPRASSVITDKAPSSDLPRLILHDSLDAAGINTGHARAAREGFCSQIGWLTELNAESSIAISRGADLAKVALLIAAEDDSLASHSSVPLSVSSFIDNLDDLSMGFCSTYLPRSSVPPEIFLGNLERYLYVHKGFYRMDSALDARSLYLHSTLTSRSGSLIMLSLIYSEVLKMLRISGFLNFDAEIYCPDILQKSLPRGYDKKKSKISDEPHIMTSKSLLVKILKDLKDAFWPFQYDPSSSLFLRAVHGKYAQHTGSLKFGDMHRSLAACERLILLNADNKELRDYAVLLYHCGYYEDCIKYLTLFEEQETENQKNPINKLEDEAVKILKTRVNLILAQDGWSNYKSS
ncbi:hypothetical protein LUZ63_017127 [Rhynchospora breviuscula]|uniref:Protein SirB1 N-terminal domain-containing protein n=1 Tax=Rhynchospora breviuscula TaxID=2022672 RepID=A0A9Q0HF78_9POAL|nr:hypothetical protein LUZ63_017127 [Rhynchospora breviuscula]